MTTTSVRVLFLNPAGGLGGAERCLLDLGASLRAHRPEIALSVILGSDGPLRVEAESLGMEVVVLPFDERLAGAGDSALAMSGPRATGAVADRAARAAMSAARYVSLLRSRILAHRPSVIHSNGIKMHLLAAAARGRVPLVWHLHDFIGERPLVSRAMRFVSRRATSAISNSHAVAADAQRLFKHLPITTIHNAVDVEHFSPSGPVADLDALAGAAASEVPRIRIGLVATYARWKGHDVFLEAARLLRSRRPGLDVLFYIVGGPIYATAASQFSLDELRRMAAALGLAGHVHFVPFQSRVDSVYRALDLIVHASSRPEPFGRTIVEAMATGKPVVVARGGGATELFSEGVDAIGVPARDPAALAEVMGRLAGDPRARRALGDAGRATAIRRFSRGRLAPATLAAYAAAGVSIAP